MEKDQLITELGARIIISLIPKIPVSAWVKFHEKHLGEENTQEMIKGLMLITKGLKQKYKDKAVLRLVKNDTIEHGPDDNVNAFKW